MVMDQQPETTQKASSMLVEIHNINVALFWGKTQTPPNKKHESSMKNNLDFYELKMII